MLAGFAQSKVTANKINAPSQSAVPAAGLARPVLLAKTSTCIAFERQTLMPAAAVAATGGAAATDAAGAATGGAKGDAAGGADASAADCDAAYAADRRMRASCVATSSSKKCRAAVCDEPSLAARSKRVGGASHIVSRTRH